MTIVNHFQLLPICGNNFILDLHELCIVFSRYDDEKRCFFIRRGVTYFAIVDLFCWSFLTRNEIKVIGVIIID